MPAEVVIPTVAVTGANGQIGYILCSLLAMGKLFGPNQQINLHMIEIEPAVPKLHGLAEEIKVTN